MFMILEDQHTNTLRANFQELKLPPQLMQSGAHRVKRRALTLVIESLTMMFFSYTIAKNSSSSIRAALAAKSGKSDM